MLSSLYIPSHFLPGPLDSRLTSIQMVSHLNAGPDICVSPLHVMSPLHPFPENCISALSKHHLKAIQNFMLVFHLHHSPVSTASRSQDSCLNSFHDLSDVWHYPYINIPPPSMLRLISIQMPMFTSHLQRHAGLKIYVFHPSNACLTCT